MIKFYYYRMTIQHNRTDPGLHMGSIVEHDGVSNIHPVRLIQEARREGGSFSKEKALAEESQEWTVHRLLFFAEIPKAVYHDWPNSHGPWPPR